MSYDLVVKGGLVVTSTETLRADVATAGERIAAIGSDLDGARTIDATGLLVIPGAIDGHVHLNDPTFPPYAVHTADSFATGTRAAAFGGTTTVVDFAQPAVGQPLVDGLEQRLADANGEAVIDYSLHLNLRDPDPARLAEVPAIFERGVPSFKLFMAYEGYRLPDAAIFRAMQAIADGGGLAVLHAENDDVIVELTSRLAAQGKRGPAWLAASCPPEGEADAVNRAIAFSAITGARLLVFHLSCIEAAREVRWAKRRRRAVIGEVTAHGLVLEQADVASGGPLSESLAVRPPLREAAQRRALWDELSDGHDRHRVLRPLPAPARRRRPPGRRLRDRGCGSHSSTPSASAPGRSTVPAGSRSAAPLRPRCSASRARGASRSAATPTSCSSTPSARSDARPRRSTPRCRSRATTASRSTVPGHHDQPRRGDRRGRRLRRRAGRGRFVERGY